MLITGVIFKEYIKCKYKAYCTFKGKNELKSDYEILLEELDNKYRVEATKAAFVGDHNDKTIKLCEFTDIQTGEKIIANTQLSNKNYTSDVLVLEKLSGKSKLGNF